MSAPITEVRELGYPDLPKVLSVERRSFPTPWSLSMFVLELSRPSSICLGAWTDGVLLGYLICARYPDAFHLMNIAVDPAHRRAGVASTLLDHLFERLEADAGITLEVRVSNASAIGLYERYGFRAVGTRARYYQDTGEDALIMWRAEGSPWEEA